jgi:hypothetical protein
MITGGGAGGSSQAGHQRLPLRQRTDSLRERFDRDAYGGNGLVLVGVCRLQDGDSSSECQLFGFEACNLPSLD